MCGLVGRAGALRTDDERIFKVLLLLDYFRGQDSTGVAIVSKKGTVDVLKIADDPIMLFNHQDYDSTVVGVSDVIWIGHNRAATVGATNRSNAHPFHCGHIVGAHNGTLDKDGFLELSLRFDENFGTDSETIFAHIAKYGVDDTIPRLKGAYALVWYDEAEETLNMIRNDKRPLYTCKTDISGRQMLTWASEYKMIVAARAMADVPDGKLVVDEEGYGFHPLPVDTLHTWTKTQLLQGELTPVTRILEGKPPVITPPAFMHQAASNTEVKDEHKSLSFPLVEDVHEVSDIDVEDTDLILGVLEQDEWDEITRFGCSCCGADVDLDMKGLMIYVNEGVVICPDCSGESETVVSNAFGLQLNDRIIG